MGWGYAQASNHGIGPGGEPARRTLSRPLTGAERDALVHRVQQTITQVDAILRLHDAKVSHLPPPSRRAYAFLAQLDPAKIVVGQHAEAAEPRGGPDTESVTFRGLRAFLDWVLDDTARLIHERQLKPAATHKVIRKTAHRLDQSIARDGLRPEHLKPQTRELVAWFRYFADEEAFARYAQAVERTQGVLAALPGREQTWRSPLLVHYRPTRTMYRWSVVARGTRIMLPTPMIAFDGSTVRELGRQMVSGERTKTQITAAMLAEPYQEVAAELESLVGDVEQTRGMAHDLAEVFDRVNRHYFQGTMARPRLMWSRTLTHRTFGHFNFVRNTVMISATLDRPDVPALVIDHEMHHELLHKKLGLRASAGQHRAHTPEFRALERSFAGYEEAARFLKQMSC